MARRQRQMCIRDRNMGAWGFVLRHWRELPLQLVARSVSATPASGSAKRSARRQKAIVEGVFEL